MEREQQLVFCKKCINRKMDWHQGLLCKLTDQKADFTDQCIDFIIDEEIAIKERVKTEWIRPNKKRAEVAQLMILIVLVLDVIAGISSYLQYDLLVSFQNGASFSNDVYNANDLREQVIAIVYMIVYIASAITFIQWFRRAYFNLNVRMKCNHSEGWAAGSWFVPIITLYRPYQIMKEMWVESSKMISTPTNETAKYSASIIGIWWTLWIISSYIGNYVFKSAFKAETVENFLNKTIADMIMSVICIPLAILAINIIKSYAQKEEELVALGK
jgi:hypothetical protein